MKISYDDYEAIMAASEMVVELIGYKGVWTDPIDVAAMLYEWMNKMKAEPEAGFVSGGGLTMIYLTESCDDEDCEDYEPASFQILINVAELTEENVHYVFDGPEIEYMESVPAEDRDVDIESE